MIKRWIYGYRCHGQYSWNTVTSISFEAAARSWIKDEKKGYQLTEIKKVKIKEPK